MIRGRLKPTHNGMWKQSLNPWLWVKGLSVLCGRRNADVLGEMEAEDRFSTIAALHPDWVFELVPN